MCERSGILVKTFRFVFHIYASIKAQHDIFGGSLCNLMGKTTIAV